MDEWMDDYGGYGGGSLANPKHIIESSCLKNESSLQEALEVSLLGTWQLSSFVKEDDVDST